MTDFAFPLPLATDPIRFFVRPGTILPVLPTPVASVGGGSIPLPQQLRNTAIHPTPASASIIRNVPVGSPLIIPMFYEIAWRDKLHIIRTSFDAGNVLSAKQNDIEIYNAGTKLPVATVDAIAIIGDSNIFIVSGNVATPFVLGLGQSEAYTYQIDEAGNATIAATIEFTFADAQQLIHTIIGTRSLVFNFEPQLPIREAFSWLTSVIQSVDGTEKRQALRELPRQQIGYGYLYNDEVENMKLENFLRSPTMNDNQGLPVWLDGTVLTSPVSIGDSVINVQSTTNRDFRALGQQGLALIRGPTTVEVISVSAFTATTITTDAINGVLTAFPVGTEVYPLRIANINKNPAQKLWNIVARDIQLVWDIKVSKDFGDETGFPTYKSTTVFDELLTHDSTSYQRNWEWEIAKLGGDTSLRSGRTLRNTAAIKSKFKLFYDSRAEYATIRNWLSARRGKQKSFWLATNRNDFELQADEVGTGVVLKAQISGYTAIHAEGIYTDIRVIYTDGTIDYRQVDSVILTEGVREELTVDTTFSQIINDANVSQISFFIKHRLDDDTIEFFHEYRGQGFVAFNIVELQE